MHRAWWLDEYHPLTTRYTTFGTFCEVALVLIVSSVLLGEGEKTKDSAQRIAPSLQVERSTGISR
jgi:hypothetical protein